MLHDYAANNRNQGFVSVSELYQYIQGQGFIPAQIDSALNFMYSKGLFETSQKGNSLKTNIQGLMVRTTSNGNYHLNFLLQSFTYIDAVLIDVSIFDHEVRGQIINTFDINQRLERATIFKDYLDKVWANSNFKDTHFIWPQRSKELKTDIETIKVKSQVWR